MTAGEGAGGWRREAAGDAFVRYLEAAPTPPGPALVLRDPDRAAAGALARSGLQVEHWDRVVRPDTTVAPWPPEGPYGTAALRLPRAKEELEMLVHAAASVLEPGGVLLVYGANDEGARSAPRRIEPLTGAVHTVMVKNRCRVLRAERPEAIDGLRDSLAAWRSTWTLEVDGDERSWVSYPGVFAHGRLDRGTALLLDAVPTPPPGARVLDFGCGSGIVGGVLLDRNPELEVDLLDIDAVALEAAAENVPGARTLLGDGLAGADADTYDHIVGNPPYHEGKAESLEAIETLVRDAPGRLRAGGALIVVVQRRLPVGKMLEERFDRVEPLAADGTYRVWRAVRD